MSAQTELPLTLPSPACLCLPLRFDPILLRKDLARIVPSEWVAHFNTAQYEGDWSGVALRSVGGKATQLYPDPTASGAFAPTEVLARCPYFKQVLAAFQCPIDAARLLTLRAGSSIREHRDYRLGYEDGEVRLHIPIVTDEAVVFVVAGAPVPMRPGEVWYINVNLPHRVDNASQIDRVHLVLDCIVNDWVRSFFPAAMRETGREGQRL